EGFVELVDRVTNAIFGKTENGKARLEGCVIGSFGQGVLDGQVDALDHGGQHRAGLHVVLVAVDADGELAGILGSLQHADARATSGSEDHVGAAIDGSLGQFAGGDRVIPGGRGGAGVVFDQLDVGIGGLGALGIAAVELVDQRNVH